MPENRMLLSGGTVVHESGSEESDILIKKDKISAIGTRGYFDHIAVDEVLDVTGKLVLPGLIDPHLHFHVQVPALQTAVVHNFHDGTIAAAHGGMTTLVDFSTQEFSTQPGSQSLLENLAERDDQATEHVFIDWSMHGILLPNKPQIFEEIPRLVEQGIPTF